MSLFGKNPNEVNYVGGEKHFVDIIKNRSTNDTFIFKNPEEDFNNGSTLVVQPGEQAVTKAILSKFLILELIRLIPLTTHLFQDCVMRFLEQYLRSIALCTLCARRLVEK